MAVQVSWDVAPQALSASLLAERGKGRHDEAPLRPPSVVDVNTTAPTEHDRPALLNLKNT
jgi:hypothetical protein